MSVAIDFVQDGKRGTFRLSGQSDNATAVDTLVTCVKHAADAGLRRVLIDGTGIEGLRVPDSFVRYRLGERVAAVSGAGMWCAVVVRPELIDRDKFGVLVARNRGFYCDVFSSLAEAEAWLAQPAAQVDGWRS